MEVIVITWSYSDNSAFGLVGVYEPELGKEILLLLEEHSGTKQFAATEVEVVCRRTPAPPPVGCSGNREIIERIHHPFWPKHPPDAWVNRCATTVADADVVQRIWDMLRKDAGLTK